MSLTYVPEAIDYINAASFFFSKQKTFVEFSEKLIDNYSVFVDQKLL